MASLDSTQGRQEGESGAFDTVPLEIENPIISNCEVNDFDDRLRLALLPGVNVESGFTVNDHPMIHKLSEIVLRLAIANFILGVLTKLGILVFVAINNTGEFKRYWFWYLADLVLFSAVAILVLCLGIHGVKTRNVKCCPCCCECCGSLTVFYIIMILAAFFSALALIASAVALRPAGLILYSFFFVLQVFTAEFSRRLLVAIRVDALLKNQRVSNSSTQASSQTHDRQVYDSEKNYLQPEHHLSQDDAENGGIVL